MNDRTIRAIGIESGKRELPAPFHSVTLLLGYADIPGAGVGLLLSDGILDCGESLNPCHVRFRFDAEPPITVRATSRFPYKALDLEGKELLKKAQQSRKFLVEVPMHRIGRQIFEFVPTGNPHCLGTEGQVLEDQGSSGRP